MEENGQDDGQGDVHGDPEVVMGINIVKNVPLAIRMQQLNIAAPGESGVPNVKTALSTCSADGQRRNEGIGHLKIKEFPVFSGARTELRVSWLNKVKRLADLHGLSENQLMKVTHFIVTEEAQSWLDSVGDIETWDEFSKLFRAEFMNNQYHSFVLRKLEDIYVDQYANISQYLRTKQNLFLELQDRMNPQMQCESILRGIPASWRPLLSTDELNDFSKMRKRLIEIQGIKEIPNHRLEKTPNQNQTNAGKPQWPRKGVCHGCGGDDHYIANCPNPHKYRKYNGHKLELPIYCCRNQG